MHNECHNYHADKTDGLCSFFTLSELNGNVGFLLCSANNCRSQSLQQVQPALMSPPVAVSDISSGRDSPPAETVKWNGFLWEAERLFVSQSKQAESKEEINTDIFRLLTAPLIYYWRLGPSWIKFGLCDNTWSWSADTRKMQWQKKKRIPKEMRVWSL